MLDVFGSVKGLIKLDQICIDNTIFRLHYKARHTLLSIKVVWSKPCVQATFVILVTASLLVTCRQYIGDPIDCIVEEIPRDAMDTYCWIHSTFRSESQVCCQNVTVMLGRSLICSNTELQQAEAHPGVQAPCIRGRNSHQENREGDKKYHKYYQWVCFTLFFQAILFYIPRFNLRLEYQAN